MLNKKIQNWFRINFIHLRRINWVLDKVLSSRRRVKLVHHCYRNYHLHHSSSYKNRFHPIPKKLWWCFPSSSKREWKKIHSNLSLLILIFELLQRIYIQNNLFHKRVHHRIWQNFRITYLHKPNNIWFRIAKH